MEYSILGITVKGRTLSRILWTSIFCAPALSLGIGIGLGLHIKELKQENRFKDILLGSKNIRLKGRVTRK